MAPDLPGNPETPWYMWRSDVGRWWATRAKPFDRSTERAGTSRTVDADDQLGLARAIADQESIAAVHLAAAVGANETPRRTGQAR